MKQLGIVLWLTLISFLPTTGGTFGEHKYIGDAAFKRFVQKHPEFADLLKLLFESEPLELTSNLIPLKNSNPGQFCTRLQYEGQYKILEYDGKAVTYGDLTALSGDHSPDFIENYTLFFKDNAFNPTGLYSNLFEKVLDQYKTQLKKLDDGGRGYNPVQLEFIKLAIQDRSHFHIPAMPLRQEIDIMGTSAYDAANDLFYSGLTGDALAAANKKKALVFFETNAVAKYSILHMIARTYYSQVCGTVGLLKIERDKVDKLSQLVNGGDHSEPTAKKLALAQKQANAYFVLARKLFLLTLFTNAFSEHYLQDMFAAGHFFTDRHARDFLGLEAKGIHDFFGRRGIKTQLQGKQILLYGDDRYTQEQLDQAIETNIASLDDLFYTDATQARTLGDDYLMMIRTPTENPTTLFPALKQIPDVPLGGNFSSQRKAIGRSISGLYYGAYGLGSSNWSGGGVTVGFNYLAVPARNTARESKLGIGFNFLAEMSNKLENAEERQARLGLGFNLLLYDWIYGSASIVTGSETMGRFEGGIQIKPLKWDYGLRIGLVNYSSSMAPDPQLTISILHF